MRLYLSILIIMVTAISVMAALDNYTRTEDGKFIISNGFVSADGYTLGTNAPITNWPSGGTTNVANWSQYPAVTNVDINNKKLDNVNAINLNGDSRTNWPAGISGSGTLLITENGNTSVLRHVTSGGHTNLLGYFHSSY